MKLYSYWRSSAAYRVRIALNLKGLDHETAFVHLVAGGGEHLLPDYAMLNPQKLVPSLELEDGSVLTQSLAIMEYLEDVCPEPPLLPADPLGRARVRALAQAVACEIHPLNNLRVLKYLAGPLGQPEEVKNGWYAHWIHQGFAALESMLSGGYRPGDFCHGETPGLADCCLVPQLYNARRFRVDLTAYPTLASIEAVCLDLPAFHEASPEEQGDAVA